MGREIRKVPPNWEHPKNVDGFYCAMYDMDFDTAFKEWCEGYELWKKGEHPIQKEEGDHDYPYWEWEGGPPDPEYHIPAFTEEPTWIQMYETVSKGTPVTPPFETKEELVEYLVENGTFWDESRVRDGRIKVAGWDRHAAEQFVKNEWAPSGYMVGGTFYTPRDGFPEPEETIK